MKQVTITWKAFNPSRLHDEAITSRTIEVDTNDDAMTLCNRVFRDTNLYSGELWDLIEPVLSPFRTHTALSVGDEVAVDGVTFRCEGAGWSEL